MSFRLIVLAVLANLLLAFPGAKRCLAASVDSKPDARQLLQKLAAYSPDPCGPPYGEEKDWHSGAVEARLFDLAADSVVNELNVPLADGASPRERAAVALGRLEKLSAEINAAWPEDNRFRFQITHLKSALLVEMGIRMHSRFFVFGIPEQDSGKPNRLWRLAGSDTESYEHDVPQVLLSLYPLRPSPSGNARFLASFTISGCAGSYGVAYEVYEWNPKYSGSLELIIKQEGAFGLDGKVPGFPQIGKLQTSGSLISLPYCWFSPIDTWDNPSLCAVDTYDISGESVSFRSRTYNRPDLLPVAKAIEYAGKRDYPAILGYCASRELARKLVRDLPYSLSAEDIRVSKTGAGRERVTLGFDGGYRFDLEKRAGRWQIVAFSTK